MVIPSPRAAQLFALSLLVSSGCTGLAPAEPPPQPPAPELVFEGLKLRVYRNGAPQLQVQSERVELMRSSGAMFAKNAHFDFSVDALTLDAPALTGNINSLSFDATGGVTFGSSDPDPGSRFVANTPSAHFEGKEGARGIATGHEPIAIRGFKAGRAFSLDAFAFRFDVEAQHATFDKVQSRVGAP